MSCRFHAITCPRAPTLRTPLEVGPVKASSVHRLQHERSSYPGCLISGLAVWTSSRQTGSNRMELQLNVTVRYAARHSESVGDVLRHFESPAWVRQMLRQVLPQLKQISPTDPKELTKMVHDAEICRPAEQKISCSICMNADSGQIPAQVIPLELPCGHRFHSTCAQSWLKRRSTCPLCRFQLPKAYTGTFVIASVRSTLLVPVEYDGLAPSELQISQVGNRMLQAEVTITMARISTEPLDSARRRRPCQVSVSMVHANGSSALMPITRNHKRRQDEGPSDSPDDVFKRVRTTAKA